MKTISKILSIVLVLSMVLGFTLMAKAANDTATVTISSYADSHNWANETKYTSVQISDDIVARVTGGANTGKYYLKGEQWRIYQTENPTLKITATGKNIVSVKITYNVDKGGTLTFDGSNISSGTKVNVNASSVTFGVGNTGTKTNGQVRITKIEVEYAEVSALPCEHTNVTYNKTWKGHTMDCLDCEDTFTEEAHTYENKVCSVCDHDLYTPANLDKVVLYYLAGDKYMTETNSSGNLSGGNATEAVELVVSVEDGKYQFVTNEGKYLTSGATGNGLSFSTKSSDLSVWTLEAAKGGWYIKNNKAAYKGNAQYLEYYDSKSAFTTFGKSASADVTIYTFLFNKTGVATEVPEFVCPHADANGDYKCDLNCGEVVPPAADSELTIEQAIALGTAHGHNSYTSNKYFVSGVVTKVTSTTYGNMQITDGNGHFLTIYGTYGIDGNDRYDAMSTKPGVGDEVVLYGIIGQFNGDAQMKNGWFGNFVIHTCEDDDNNHKCDICDKTISEHKDDNKDHVCDNGCSVAIGDHTVDADKDHKCDYCKEIISEHKDDNKDHVCDNGCSVAIGDHTVDTDKDHKCDYCKKALSECKDDNKDHKCDLCTKTLSECKDDNKDHKCDLCTKVISECEFNSADYVTSKDGHAQSCACGKVGEIKAHADADKNGKCDVCEYKVEVPNSGSNNQTNTNNPKDGDAMSIISVVSTMVLSMSGVVALVIKKKSF